MNKTISYYNRNAADYFSTTMGMDISPIYEKFVSYLPSKASILDVGCGSGRDSLFFLNNNYKVCSIDGAKDLAEKANNHLGIDVKVMNFNELSLCSVFDAAWACASLLHLSRDELVDTVYVLTRHLRPKGILYTSFKHGTFYGFRGERFFQDVTLDSFSALLDKIPAIAIIDSWNTPGQKGQKEGWINFILRNEC